MSDGERMAHTIDRKGIVVNGVSGRVVMIFGHNVVPCPWAETLQWDSGVFPAMCSNVKDSPLARRVICLPRKIVGIATESLLALKFDCLGIILHSRRDVQVELVPQGFQCFSYGRMAVVPVGIGV